MTSLHSADIAARLKRLLARRSVPRRLEGKLEAMADEVAALARRIQRSAPRGAEALADWWPAFEDAIGAKGGPSWPTEQEIAEALLACRPQTTTAPLGDGLVSAGDAFSVGITAARMAKGQGVGEGWLWGRNAVDLERSGLVDAATMRRYRTAAFVARKQAYGEAAALAWEDHAKWMHDAAKATAEGKAPPAPMPQVKRMHTPHRAEPVEAAPKAGHWSDAIPAGMEHDIEAIREARRAAGLPVEGEPVLDPLPVRDADDWRAPLDGDPDAWRAEVTA